MGIDTRGKLMVGLWMEDLLKQCKANDVDPDEVDEMVDNEELEYASPYYDSPRSAWFIGIEINGGDLGEVFKQIALARAEFKTALGEAFEPEVRGVAHVY